MGISSATMLGVSCYATSSCEKQLALRETSLSFFKPVFSPWAIGCVLCPHLSYLPVLHPPVPHFICWEQTWLYEDVKIKKKKN